MALQICHLWADALSWNGSRGNLTCLEKRLAWRGIPAETAAIPVGGEVSFDDHDLVYIGAGRALANKALLEDVRRKAEALRAYAQAGGAVLAVCEGFELLGKTITPLRGEPAEGMFLLDLTTEYGADRLTGNALYSYRLGELVVFENHAGRVRLGPATEALATVIRGSGNNGQDKKAGARKGNVFGCHAHGPLLPKNPVLADDVLRAALARRSPAMALRPLPDTLEEQAHHVMEQRLR